jgi:hypothetical protein
LQCSSRSKAAAELAQGDLASASAGIGFGEVIEMISAATRPQGAG